MDQREDIDKISSFLEMIKKRMTGDTSKKRIKYETH